MGDAILVVDNVYKYFGGVRAVDGVSLSVPRRGIVGLIGPNGSGKTTLFNVISGVYKPDRGRIVFDSIDITGWSPDKVYRLGLVRTFQTPRVWSSLTVFENILGSGREQRGESPWRALFRRLWRRQEEEYAAKAIEWADFTGLIPVIANLASDISGGQMKLLEIARALMGGAKMLLLDEPAAGVNPTLARRVFEGIKSLRDKLGLTFLIIEHRLEILFDYVDYVYVMHQGRVVAEGKPSEVAENPVVVDIYLGG